MYIGIACLTQRYSFADNKPQILRLIVRMSPYIVEIDLYGRNPYK